MMKASINLNRFSIVYEIASEFVLKARKKFSLQTLAMDENLYNFYIAKHLQEASA